MYRENRHFRVVDAENNLIMNMGLDPEFNNEEERMYIANYIEVFNLVNVRVVIIDNGYVVANYNI